MPRILVLFIACLICSASPADAAHRALSVGIDTYDNIGQLKRAVNDARSVAALLRSIGYDVLLGENITRSEFNSLWQRLMDKVEPGDTVVFFFSGHGVEIDTQNFLLPRDIPSVRYGRQEQLRREALSVTEFLHDLRVKTPQVSLVILDACRSAFPLPEMRSAGAKGGLAGIKDPPEGTFIMYSAGAGEEALDRLPNDDPDPVNSIYTRKLLPLMTRPGLSLPQMAQQLRSEVRDLAGSVRHVQRPAYYDGLIGRFCLTTCEVPAHPASMQVIEDPADEAAWNVAKGGNLAALRKYVDSYPRGRGADQAWPRIAELERMEARWRELSVSRNLPRLEAFVADAASSEFPALADARLRDLRPKEAKDWQIAEEENRLAAYEMFLSSWSEGFFADDARAKIEALRAIRSEWDRLRPLDDEKLLEEFIARHGWSEFGAAATARLVVLRRERLLPEKDDAKTLSAQELLAAIDGAEIRFANTGDAIRFDTKSMPPYRSPLGRNFLKSLMKLEAVFSEGAFKAFGKAGDKTHAKEGLGAIVESQVDKTGSLFLMQMFGGERSERDVNQKDRHFITLHIVRDSYGYVCNGSHWQLLKATTAPVQRVERCFIRKK